MSATQPLPGLPAAFQAWEAKARWADWPDEAMRAQVADVVRAIGSAGHNDCAWEHLAMFLRFRDRETRAYPRTPLPKGGMYRRADVREAMERVASVLGIERHYAWVYLRKYVLAVVAKPALRLVSGGGGWHRGDLPGPPLRLLPGIRVGRDGKTYPAPDRRELTDAPRLLCACEVSRAASAVVTNLRSFAGRVGPWRHAA